MFRIGDYVAHYKEGVCEVVNIGKIDMGSSDKEYYTLKPDTITTIVSRYYKQDTWKKDLIFRQESFDLLQDILEDAGELKKRAPYKNLVTTIYAEKSAKAVKDTTLSH